MKRWTVADVMCRDVVTVPPDTGFHTIADLLVSRAISAVPVVDGDRHVVGVVSEADLLGKLEYTDRVPHHPLAARRLRSGRNWSAGNTAADLMSAPAVTIRSVATVSQAARLMDAARVKRLPVLDADGELVGIVSRRDLVRLYARPDADLYIAIMQDLRDLGLDVAGTTVSVVRGVVTISGAVERYTTSAVIVGLLSATPGVVDVVDELSYTVDDADRFVEPTPYPPAAG